MADDPNRLKSPIAEIVLAGIRVAKTAGELSLILRFVSKLSHVHKSESDEIEEALKQKHQELMSAVNSVFSSFRKTLSDIVVP